MSDTRSRAGILVGLGAAAACFGAAAMLSATTAPTAHADDFSDIMANVNEDLTFGQAAFTLANGYFGESELVPGLTAFFNGTNDDTLSAPQSLLLGTIEASTNESISGIGNFQIQDPFDLAGAVSLAQSYFATGEADLGMASTLLAEGYYGPGTAYDLVGADYAYVVPLEELLLGVVASFTPQF